MMKSKKPKFVSRKNVVITLLLFLMILSITAIVDIPYCRVLRSQKFQRVDSILIHRLHGSKKQLSHTRFFVGKDWESVYGSISLAPEKTARFMGIWKEISLDGTNGAMCHFPPYGIELQRKGNTVFRTSICWECANVHLNTRFYGDDFVGFDSGDQMSKELLQFLDHELPYLRGFREKEEEEIRKMIKEENSHE